MRDARGGAQDDGATGHEGGTGLITCRLLYHHSIAVCICACLD